MFFYIFVIVLNAHVLPLGAVVDGAAERVGLSVAADGDTRVLGGLMRREVVRGPPEGSRANNATGELVVAGLVEGGAMTDLPRTVLKDHKECNPLYPDLETFYGYHGDVCRTRDKQKRDWHCPRGCVEIASGEDPYCVKRGTRSACRMEDAINTTWGREFANSVRAGGLPKWTTTGILSHFVCARPHAILNWRARQGHSGDRCWGGAQNWMAPKGCELSKHWTQPFTVQEGTQQPCRVAGISTMPLAFWELVASGTHGVQASLEVGISSLTSNNLTKGSVQTFKTEVEWEGSFGMKAALGYEAAHAIAETVEAAIEQSHVRTVVVDCPNQKKTTEYIWQFVASDGSTKVKTDNYRCHYSTGDPKKPQCPPQMCGDTESNPYCEEGLCLKQSAVDPPTWHLVAYVNRRDQLVSGTRAYHACTIPGTYQAPGCKFPDEAINKLDFTILKFVPEDDSYPTTYFDFSSQKFDSTARRKPGKYALSESDALAGRWQLDSCRSIEGRGDQVVLNFGRGHCFNHVKSAYGYGNTMGPIVGTSGIVTGAVKLYVNSRVGITQFK